MSIGANIRRLRIAAGMSQEDLAKKLNKTRSAVSQYETGISVPRMGVISDVARVFGVKITEIIDNDTCTEMLRQHDENELLTLFRSLDETGKKALLSCARGLQGGFKNRD